MVANESGAKLSQVAEIRAREQQDKLPTRRPYEAPELHEIGSLAQLQAYGASYRDGSRYKD